GTDGGVDRALVEPDLGELHSRRVRVDPHAVQRAHRVRAPVLDARVAVQEDHAVADARRPFQLDLLARERQRAFGDHAGEPGERAGVGVLRLAGATARGRGGLAGEGRDLRAAVADRDALQSPLLLAAQHVRLALDLLAPPPRAGDERTFDLVDDVADEIGHVQ